ncbi:hypothetical protein MDAP_000180 [Mitosporidium daphniae]|uniref:Uncharacterized protein n=1 Tax=Mitosporidium daphniae TaxID=1485682 RepID=A0A098VNU4_9MICR|nr:uncharacterized protein DI09_59p80 [Mitosporidium daphniae]KGG50718.1 hypothetical protein DI09_59p80 [Mitosporidium daphniae]|eukprot:XP_013237161.1 uncharacterized protein DI09_59p80 [Mitosporidium daphniae]
MNSLKQKRSHQNNMESQKEDDYRNSLNDTILKHKTPSEKEVERRAKVEEMFSIPMNVSRNDKRKKETPWYDMQPTEAVELNPNRPGDPLLKIKSATNTRKSEDTEYSKTNSSSKHAPYAGGSSEYDRLRSERLIREKRERERQDSLLRTNKFT